MWYVYILKCKTGEFYKGCTNDIEDRVHRHQKGYVNSTKLLLPITLVCYTTFLSQSKAYEFEKYLKSGSGRAFINKHFIWMSRLLSLKLQQVNSIPCNSTLTAIASATAAFACQSFRVLLREVSEDKNAALAAIASAFAFSKFRRIKRRLLHSLALASSFSKLNNNHSPLGLHENAGLYFYSTVTLCKNSLLLL